MAKPKKRRLPRAPDGREYLTVELLCVELALQCPLGKLPLKCLVDMVYTEAFRYLRHLANAGHTDGTMMIWQLSGSRYHATIAGIIGMRMRKGLPHG